MLPQKWAYSLIIPVEIGGNEDGPGLACCSRCLALKGIGDGLSVLSVEPSWEFERGRRDAMQGALHHVVDVPYSGSAARVRKALQERWKHPRFVCRAERQEDGSLTVTWPEQPGCGEVKALLGVDGGKRFDAFTFEKMKPWLLERNVLIMGSCSVVSADWKLLKQPKHERKTFTAHDRQKYLDSLRNPHLSDEERLQARIDYLKAQARE
ncbi:hypothetical protein B9Y60_10555 [Stenotrophomonas maltophilia]|nr:hypothetical protein B9Y73_10555 [Stenotrophomonas maltophilia]PJL55116.1 hypothetical protein B9Y60_10555 [Stenotrophomonas maltophilia]